MKVNGLLFLILVGLIFFTYQFEEKEFKKKLIPTDRVYPFKNTIFNKIKGNNTEKNQFSAMEDFSHIRFELKYYY